jgi:hypothetical protein
LVGSEEGSAVGVEEGSAVGAAVGSVVGAAVGSVVGSKILRDVSFKFSLGRVNWLWSLDRYFSIYTINKSKY